jgi:hypothetical protein
MQVSEGQVNKLKNQKILKGLKLLTCGLVPCLLSILFMLLCQQILKNKKAMQPQDIAPGTPQQQVIERLRTAVNVLVTVSNNPSVDQLAAAIGFTLTLNKLGKHATAVFSGQVPSTIEFLKPDATIEKNTDSLRDFIVSLDKSKADKLRYKVEENIVKIFITPYRTSLSEKDLLFSQGDFNVDAVVALGISEREQLDQAIVAHGRILHDATVITASAGKATSSLGAINWQDNAASSLCEMLVAVADALQPGLLDSQIATAYLTGIVAQTERFRNEKTTPKLMTLAAQLMAAGANQQLIATQLEHAVEASLKPTAVPIAPEGDDGALTIEHAAEVKEVAEEAGQIAIDEHGNLSTKEEASSTPPPQSTVQQTAEEPAKTPEPTAAEEPKKSSKESKPKRHLLEPVSPVAPEAKSKDAFFAGGPHPFTADLSEDGQDEPSTDPLTAADNATPEPLLSHDQDTAKTVGSPDAAIPAPVPTPEPSAMLPPVADTINSVPLVPLATSEPTQNEESIPPAMDSNTLRDIEKTFDSTHIAHDPHSTLNEIEEVEHSPHLSGAVGAPTPTVDTARDAVSSVLESTYDPTRPAARQSLNAAPLNLPGLSSTPPLNTPQPASDPVLAGLGLTDQVTATPAQPAVILPPPPSQTLPPSAPLVMPTAPDASTQAPPPVPPPLLPQ